MANVNVRATVLSDESPHRAEPVEHLLMLHLGVNLLGGGQGVSSIIGRCSCL